MAVYKINQQCEPTSYTYICELSSIFLARPQIPRSVVCRGTIQHTCRPVHYCDRGIHPRIVPQLERERERGGGGGRDIIVHTCRPVHCCDRGIHPRTVPQLEDRDIISHTCRPVHCCDTGIHPKTVPKLKGRRGRGT